MACVEKDFEIRIVIMGILIYVDKFTSKKYQLDYRRGAQNYSFLFMWTVDSWAD